MSTIEMDPVFTASLREALITNVLSAPRTKRRWHWRIGAGMIVSLTLAAGGVAIATGLFTQPGTSVDTQLGSVVIATRTGTATIEMGTPPAGTTDVSLKLTCLTVGTFDFPNGSRMTCSAVDLSKPSAERTTSEVEPISPGVDALTIVTSSKATWTLQATYVNQVSTAWGINANGQTFGVPNQNGTPDLVAVFADNPKIQGYVKESDLNCAAGGDISSPAEAAVWDKVSQNRNVSIAVYQSDGETVVGTFTVGSATGPNAETVPLSSLSLGC
jgi:hypothetical protein